MCQGNSKMITNNTTQDMQVWTYCVDKNACVGGNETYYWFAAFQNLYIPECPSGDVEGFIIKYRDYVQGGSPGCPFEYSYVLIFDQTIICNNDLFYPGTWNPTTPYIGYAKKLY